MTFSLCSHQDRWGEENFQDRNRGFPILRRRGPMLEKIKL
jgi:hypothetical protein